MSEKLLRLNQILGQEEVTQEVAEVNRAKSAAIRMEFPANDPDPVVRKKQKKLLAKKLSKIGPRSRQPEIKAMIPISASNWWEGVASGRYPASIKLGGGRTTCWRESDVLALMKMED